MPEQTVVTQVQEPQVETKPVDKPVDDLVSRVSQIKTEPPKIEDSKFNVNDLDAELEKIQDSNLKNQMLALKKSLISGENQKYQELAKLRKDYEQKLSEQTTWTPGRVQGLLNDPTFVKSAQEIMSGQQTPSDDTSMLSESEKAKLAEVERLRREVADMRRQGMEVARRQQDEALKSRYANYNPEAIDIITADLLAGKMQATREHLWKVIDYESAINRAYELGRQDRKLDTGERIQSNSYEGTSVTGTETPLKKEQGESDRDYFKRLGEYNLKKFLSRTK